MSGHIKSLKVNEIGRDFIMADLHGEKDCLDAVIKTVKLQKGDRLVLAGDLMDRGPDSVGVIERIIESNKSGLDIIALKGNHDDWVIKSILALEFLVRELVKQGKAVSVQNVNDLLAQLSKAELNPETEALLKNLMTHLHPANGGEWLLKLFVDEFDKCKKCENCSAGKNCENTKIKLENGEIKYTQDSKVSMVNEFLQDLPYIISVDGEDEVSSYNVVHASMPFDDEELKKRIQSELGLTADEIKYATEVRPGEYNDTILRNIFSRMTYVGHQIIGRIAGDFLRMETSTAYLDFAAYARHISLVVDHKARKVVAVSSRPEEEVAELMQVATAIAEELSGFLNDKFYLPQLRTKIQAIIEELAQSPVDDVVTVLNKKIEQLNQEWSAMYTPSKLIPLDRYVFLFIANLDLSMPENNLRMVMSSIIESNINKHKGKLKTKEAVDEVVSDINYLTEIFNFRTPETPLVYDDLSEKLEIEVVKKTADLASEATVANLGIFSIDTGDAFAKLKLEQEIASVLQRFKDEKNAAYSGLYGVINPKEVVTDVVELVTTLNTKIRMHNQLYPQYDILMLSAQSFFAKERDFGVYAELTRIQKDFLSRSLMIDDLKQSLLTTLTESTQDRLLKIRECHAKISDIIDEYPNDSEQIKQQDLCIQAISLQELCEFFKPADQTQPVYH